MKYTVYRILLTLRLKLLLSSEIVYYKNKSLGEYIT